MRSRSELGQRVLSRYYDSRRVAVRLVAYTRFLMDRGYGIYRYTTLLVHDTKEHRLYPDGNPRPSIKSRSLHRPRES